MKTLILLHIVLLLVIASCKQGNADSIAKFIPGTYIRHSVHEFGSEYDTLTITAIAGQYQIERKWKFLRTLDGQRLDPEYKSTSMTGIFKEGILTEQQTGVHYSFDPDKKCLYSGDTRYDKR